MILNGKTTATDIYGKCCILRGAFVINQHKSLRSTSISSKLLLGIRNIISSNNFIQKAKVAHHKTNNIVSIQYSYVLTLYNKNRKSKLIRVINIYLPIKFQLNEHLSTPFNPMRSLSAFSFSYRTRRNIPQTTVVYLMHVLSNN